MTGQERHYGDLVAPRQHGPLAPAEQSAPRSRLPSLGNRGGGWVGLQVIFLGAAVAAGVFGAPWPEATRVGLGVPGAVALLAGAGLLLGGGAGLGQQLTPFPRPVTDGTLRQDGVYRLVRHPMYGGALVLVLGWALLSSPFVLLALGLAAALMFAKSRREEAWLVEQYPGYEEYRRQVPHRFLPWLW
ncbi:MAG: isoprenylcysteine carboxylmethyltransferase family protein [Actinomycetales bacterium]|nr:isoprenylcysteine carboxylmethyltransferase family protein [Actinomycetales bacterium]